MNRPGPFREIHLAFTENLIFHFNQLPKALQDLIIPTIQQSDRNIIGLAVKIVMSPLGKLETYEIRITDSGIDIHLYPDELPSVILIILEGENNNATLVPFKASEDVCQATLDFVGNQNIMVHHTHRRSLTEIWSNFDVRNFLRALLK